jgi:hypothetical protein
MVHMTIFEILFTSGETLRLEGADGYQPEGVMTTFFASGSSRSTIDSWSTRIASYRTADVVSVVRTRRDIIDLTVVHDDVALARAGLEAASGPFISLAA